MADPSHADQPGAEPSGDQPSGDQPSGDRPPAYQALYRRFRPQRFADVLGQEHVTRALRNSVRDHKVAHAYLFSGPRGTGKTSTARILAMALNCEHPVDGEPDGTCASCESIRAGASMDVQELDAASNRRLEEMRDLLARVPLGTPGRWKVYIVDEVHQLTGDASSALLKTLEEPPGHVIFVLATTDPQKVLPTIRSRTQHLEFRLLSPDVLGELLRDVNGKAHLGVPVEAIDLVVRRGRGSARDALSVLDQVAAAGSVEDDPAAATDIADAISDKDPGRALQAVSEAVSAGRDPRRIAGDVLEHLRNGFLATRARSLVALPDDAAADVERQARRMGTPMLVRAMEVIGQALIDMRDSVDPRITLEVALVRLSAADADASPAALLERVERLEKTVAQLAAGRGQSGSAVPPAPDPGPQPAPEPGDGAGQSASPAADARAALGAHRRPREVPAGSGTPAGSGAPPPSAPPASAPPASGAPTSGPPAAGSPSARPPAAGPPASAAAASTAGASAAGASAAAGASTAGASAAGLPTREEITLAWGDAVLPGLRPAVKAYVANGRFIAVDGSAAVYALPDKGLLGRAEPLRPEIEGALATHFGRSVPLRLVLDDAVVARPAPLVDDPADFDLSQLDDAPVAALSPEQRLLQAFPGAEEVLP